MSSRAAACARRRRILLLARACALHPPYVGARWVVDSLDVLAHGLGRSGRDDGLKVAALAEYFGIGMRASRVRMVRM